MPSLQAGSYHTDGGDIQDIEHNHSSQRDEAEWMTGYPQHAMLLTHLSFTTGNSTRAADHEKSPLLTSYHRWSSSSSSYTEEKEYDSSTLLLNAWQWYEERIQHSPLLTKMITAGILVGLADAVSQVLVACHSIATPSKAVVDWYRIYEFFLLGLIVQAPITHYYYKVLDYQLPPTPSPWTKTTLLKLTIDQTCFAPSFLLLVFAFLDAMDYYHDNVDQDGKIKTLHFIILQHLQRDFLSTLVANWKLWIPATFLNLAFCPPRFRVLFCNVVFFVWSIILAMLLPPAVKS